MEDLSGLSWAASAASDTPPMSNASYYPSLRPTPPISGRSTPLSAQTANGPLKPSAGAPIKTSTPTNDSFSNLVSFTPTTSTKTLSLQEQQKRLEEEKAKQEDERRKQFDAHFGVHKPQLRQTNGNGRATSDLGLASTTSSGTEGYGTEQLSSAVNKPFANIAIQPQLKPADDVEDLLAAFDTTAPVDTSSNFPVPLNSSNSYGTSGVGKDVSTSRAAPQAALFDLAGQNMSREQVAENEDDLFGLGGMNHTSARLAPTQAERVEEDDVLGLLGKPVSELPPRTSVERQTSPEDGNSVDHPRRDKHPQDQAVAELVEMGFSAEKSMQALGQTDTGLDIQAAVGWLLSQAHKESRQEHRGRASLDGTRRWSNDRNAKPNGHKVAQNTGNLRGDAQMPAWIRQESRSNSTQRRQDSNSPANGDKDATQYAAEIGSNLFKSVNSLWKTGIKKIEQTVGEYNSDSDSSQPKWMRTPADGIRRTKVSTPGVPTATDADTNEKLSPEDGFQQRASNGPPQTSITDEALMLESSNSRPTQRTAGRSTQPNSRLPPSSMSSREPSPASTLGSTNQRASQPGYLQRQHVHVVPKAKLSRALIDEQSSVAYVSPARRKRPPPKPADSEPNLLADSPPVPQAPRSSSTAPTIQQRLLTRPQAPPKHPPPLTNITTRPKAPPRKIPPVSTSALSSSSAHRQKGADAFKLGDYAAAHAAYTSALSPLPDQHPLTIIILCNRALTNLKIGEPKAAVSDTDTALSLIGPSHGEGETIDLGPNEPPKAMRDFYGKALMRKAEALEQMERWSDAAKVWREAIESGHGGSTSIQGRDRSEKAAGRSSHPSAPAARTRPPPPSAKPAPPPKKQSALDALSSQPAPSAEAVRRLRAANAAAERADDEKFALADSVDARLGAWKGGKQDNLRALLGSLDTVLWSEAGWKKVGLHELVLAGKVKVVYMRGIAKVHPDKLPPTATTEQRMISGAVFSTLNEAWDKFKKENGL